LWDFWEALYPAKYMLDAVDAFYKQGDKDWQSPLLAVHSRLFQMESDFSKDPAVVEKKQNKCHSDFGEDAIIANTPSLKYGP
jgi:hypothetical protein